MQTFDPDSYLLNNLESLNFAKRLNWLFDHIIEKVPCWHKLSHDEQSIYVFKVLNQFQNVLAFHLGALLHNLKFLEDLIIRSKRAIYRSLVY